MGKLRPLTIPRSYKCSSRGRGLVLSRKLVCRLEKYIMLQLHYVPKMANQKTTYVLYIFQRSLRSSSHEPRTLVFCQQAGGGGEGYIAASFGRGSLGSIVACPNAPSVSAQS